MKKIVLAAFAAAIATPAIAAPGDTDTAAGTATATIVAPISVDHVAGEALAFGTITAGNGGTVTVDLAGTVTDNGDDAVVLTGSTTSADAFTLSFDHRHRWWRSADRSGHRHGIHHHRQRTGCARWLGRW